jgi:hypothetical protein
MKLSLLPLAILATSLSGYDIPRWYRAYHWCDEPYFSKAWLSQLQLTLLGGSHTTDRFPPIRRLSQAELWLDIRQNFQQGVFIHMQLPWSWQRIYTGNLHTQERSGLVTPSLTAGYALNYESLLDIDFIDVTVQTGCVLGSPHATIQSPVAQATSTQPALLVHGSWAIGFLDWATLGNHLQIIGYTNHALYSTSIYAQMDHIIPTLSLSGAFTVQGQAGTASVGKCTLLQPWYMVCCHLDVQIDTCTEDHPSRPYFHGFVDIPLAGKHVIATTVWGGALGLYVSWCW